MDLSVSTQCLTLYNWAEKRKEERKKNSSFERYSQDVSIDETAAVSISSESPIVPPSCPRPINATEYADNRTPFSAPLCRSLRSSKRKRRSIDRSIRSLLLQYNNTIAPITRNQMLNNKVYFSRFLISEVRVHYFSPSNYVKTIERERGLRWNKTFF